MQTAARQTNLDTQSDEAKAAAKAAKGKGRKVAAMLKARLGDDVYTSWFKSMEFDAFDGNKVTVSVPVVFLRNWIRSQYADDLLVCCQADFPGAKSVDVVLRQPAPAANPQNQPNENQQAGESASTSTDQADGGRVFSFQSLARQTTRTQAGDLEGSPLDTRYTLDSFVVGPSNRVAHASAVQVAETVMSDHRGINPLYIHSSVGMGKTHLLHAIAWEAKRRTPQAQVLYLTAERFRYQFVEAVRGSDPLSFKDRFRSIDMLLVDDLEFMTGEKTEQEFDHIINALLDGGRQVVVASARPPAHIERLHERMRSRLQRGLVTEIGPYDKDLRLKVLEKRLSERKVLDPTFTLSPDVLDVLAERLTENGRELEGAVTRLYANWQYMRTPITRDIAETVIRDLVQGIEPRRIKIEDILRIISRHFGVSKGDLLSQRRHRSVVWPRQIGMYLAKQMTARSLPEIGRRFGGRDHTTVLHAIRKIDRELNANTRLRDEIDELKKLLSH